MNSKVARRYQVDRLTVPEQEGGKVCLRVALVKVRSRNANKAVETYPLLDSGSDISLCDKTLAMELGVRGQGKHSS